MVGNDLRLLPPEIWTEILTRVVPVKSILRCRSVCKSWYSLISYPNFISEYSTRNLNKNGNSVLLKLYHSRFNVRSISSHDESFMESLEHDDDFPGPFRGQDLGIVGSCNGLICLSKCSRFAREDIGYGITVTFLIWNPTIRKVVELPSRTYYFHGNFFSYFGFGFDSKTSDYKVLCNVGDLRASDYANACAIYDLRKGIWRGISPVIPFLNVNCCHEPECYLNGAVHWTGFRYRSALDNYDRPHDRALLAFNMSDELFRKIKMPDSAQFTGNGDNDEDKIETRSVTFHGLIHVIVWTSDASNYVDVSQSCSVWVMKEYGVTESWTKMFNIDLQSARLYPFCLWKNGEVLILQDSNLQAPGVEADDDVAFRDHQGLILYNSESRKCKRLFSITKCIKDVCLYEESLVLM